MSVSRKKVLLKMIILGDSGYVRTIYTTDSIDVRTCVDQPRAGSGVVRIDALRFLDGCRTRQLNQV